MKRTCLALLFAISATTANAIPITYVINFTGGPDIPTGSFVYDSELQEFDEFNLQLGTHVFGSAIGDLNREFEGMQAQVFAMLSEETCCWNGKVDQGAIGISGVVFFTPLGTLRVSSDHGDPTPFSGSGAWTISQVPEPGSLALVVSAIAAAAWVRRK